MKNTFVLTDFAVHMAIILNWEAQDMGVDGVAVENGNDGDIKDNHSNDDNCYQGLILIT